MKRFVLSLLLALPMGAGAAPDHPVYELPAFQSDFRVDGDPADWGSSGLRVELLSVRDLPRPAVADFEPRLRLAWTDRGLAVLVEVQDDVIHGSTNGVMNSDCLELFFAGGWNTSEYFQLVVHPNFSGSPATQLVDRRVTTKTPVKVESAAVRVAGGYRVEMLLPWEAVGLSGKSGSECAFTIQVNDVDRPHQQRRMAVWYPAGWGSAGPKNMHWLKLGGEGSAVPALAFHTAWRLAEGVVGLNVWAPARCAGDSLAVRDGTNVLATGQLAAKDGRSAVELMIAIPAVGKTWTTGPELVANGVSQSLLLASPENERGKAIGRLELEFEQFAFVGENFPACRFTDSLLAERVLGSARVEVQFFDAAYNPVTKAAAPGRYGAQAVVYQGDKEIWRRRFTLFRLTKELNWRQFKPPIHAALPAELGFPAEFAERQNETVAGLYRDGFLRQLTRTMDGAVSLAALAEAATNAPAFTDRTSPWRQHQNWWHGLSKKLGEPGLAHFVLVPENYAAEPNRKWPVILFLHGAGERGHNLNSVRGVGLPPVAAARRDFPFIVVCPQCPGRDWWFPAPILDLLDQVEKQYRVDRDRVYVSGLSMGGFGTWALLAEAPERFAAAAPICGGGDPREVDRYQRVPVWAFHGTKDTTVLVERSREMVDALQKLAAPAALTEYPEAGHNSWDETYRDNRLYDWLLANRRGQPPVKPPVAK